MGSFPFPQQRRVPSPCSAHVPLTWEVTHGGCHLKPKTISGRWEPREPPHPSRSRSSAGLRGPGWQAAAPGPDGPARAQRCRIVGTGESPSGPSRCPAGPDRRPGSGGLTRGGGHTPFSGDLRHLPCTVLSPPLIPPGARPPPGVISKAFNCPERAGRLRAAGQSLQSPPGLARPPARPPARPFAVGHKGVALGEPCLPLGTCRIAPAAACAALRLARTLAGSPTPQCPQPVVAPRCCGTSCPVPAELPGARGRAAVAGWVLGISTRRALQGGLGGGGRLCGRSRVLITVFHSRSPP